MSETRRLLLDFETEVVAKKARENKKAREELIRALGDASDVVRERALFASIDLGDPEIVNEIVKSLSDDEEDVRIAAAEALAFYHQPRTVPNLLKGLKDSNTWVRSHCARGLSKLMNGPIWARVPKEDIDKILDDFPDMTDEEIQLFLSGLKLSEVAINKLLRWKSEGFENVEIDTQMLEEELEARPIILPDAEVPSVATTTPSAKTGISHEVEEILAELPEEIRKTLPPEDMRRLTVKTARELVDSLKESLPEREEEPEEKPPSKKKKKKVKVRKVKKVPKKKTKSREDLIEKIPDEVKDSLPEGALNELSIEDLEALIATDDEEMSEEEKSFRESDDTPKTKKELIKSLPDEVKEEIAPSTLKRMKKAEIEELLEESTGPSDQESREEYFVSKYGVKKAKILITLPQDMLDGIPEEQIEEMDVDTLKGLAEALEPR